MPNRPSQNRHFIGIILFTCKESIQTKKNILKLFDALHVKLFLHICAYLLLTLCTYVYYNGSNLLKVRPYGTESKSKSGESPSLIYHL